MKTVDLSLQHCEACEGIGKPLNKEQVAALKPQIAEDWIIADNLKKITRSFAFKNFYQTMAFVNAIAWVANSENHHPDLEVGYNYCHVNFMTHALQGLSQNDFICAAKVDKLFA